LQAALERLYRARDRLDHDIAEAHRKLGSLPEYLPLKFCAHAVGFNPETLRVWAEAGRINARRIGGRWEIHLDDLQVYVGMRHGLHRRCA
jgi:hypothetical protein